MTSKQVLHGSSPSSGGAESTHGTPETRLTPFSSVKSLKDNASLVYISKHSPTIDVASTLLSDPDATEKDPFISTSTKARCEHSVLSPTASAFQPFAFRISQETGHTPMVAKSPGPSDAINLTKLSKEYIAISSTPAASQSAINTQSGTFSSDLNSVTRAIQISSPTDALQVGLIQTCVQKACNYTRGSLKFARCGSDVLIRFSDLFDALKAYNEVKSTCPEWFVEFISPAAFAEKTNPESPYVSTHEGQIHLVANFPASGCFDRTKLEGIILDLLSVDGVVYAWRKQLATEAGTLRLVAEYSDVNSAARAIERLNGATVRGINISVAFHEPDISTSPRYQGRPSTPTRGRPNARETADALSSMPVVRPSTVCPTIGSSAYASLLSPTGRSFLPTTFAISPAYSSLPVTFGGRFSPASNTVVSLSPPAVMCSSRYSLENFGSSLSLHHGFVPHIATWDDFESPSRGQQRGSPILRYSARRQNTPRGGNRSSHGNNQVGQHNVVDIDRIRAGVDVRTTIMLRNIPNKIDQSQLKAIVDQTSRGLYDFMYLRIDFANNCNVGYAFINFEDPYHIINFVAARAGQRWNRYSSDKIAEVSYATIQGKDCLVQKFRNSSVMLEHPSFRPKIFYTGSHSRVGEEDDFPLPDNASKMRRSVENAEHVGLFAPRAGQHYRDEQRRRRSRYDRGTRLAALEEYDFEDYYQLEHEFQN